LIVALNKLWFIILFFRVTVWIFGFLFEEHNSILLFIKVLSFFDDKIEVIEIVSQSICPF
jgi:hypothetical protein